MSDVPAGVVDLVNYLNESVYYEEDFAEFMLAFLSGYRDHCNRYDVEFSIEKFIAAIRDAAVELGWQPHRRVVPPKTRTLVFRRDGYACVDCHEDDVRKLSIDHRVAVHLGGGNEPENLITRCRSCNSSKGVKL